MPSMSAAAISFDNSYARLPDRFFARMEPAPVSAPSIIRFNSELAEELGLNAAALNTPAGAQILAGNEFPDGADPIAMAYAGHQFGGWSPQLGDGRALLLGEVIDKYGQRRDIQLKGSGPTPFSRMGDGRSALGPAIREYLISEAMHALGVPTTRSLAVVETGEPVARETMQPGGISTRVAASHMRVGTFQFFAARQDLEGLTLLADHAIERHYPDVKGAENPYLALLECVIARQADLIAHWMSIGFIHGVMNTDNMTISGETIDYGPCAFMDWYKAETVYSSIDQRGRYAYRNQPGIGQWNLVKLAQTLLPLIDADEEKAVAQAQAAIEHYADLYHAAWLGRFRAKVGFTTEHEGDGALLDDLLERMTPNQADFTQTFRYLSDAIQDGEGAGKVRDLFVDPTACDGWLEQWRARLALEPEAAGARQARMNAVNPLYIPRNHLVEEAIAAAYEGDYEPFRRLNDVLSRPFAAQQGYERYILPPEPGQIVHQTFCGT